VTEPPNAEPLRTSVTFDRIADRYDETRGGLARGNDLANSIDPHLPAGARIVEPGVGTGAIALPLTERGFDVIGFDLSAPMLARAHDRLGNRVGRADVQQLPVADASVDAVVTVWILHVVADPAQLTSEISRILKPGGRWCAISADAVHEPDEIAPINHSLDVALGRYRDAPPRVRAWAEANGMREIHNGTATPWHFPQSPLDVVANIESRTWSSCWDLTDDDWAAKVQPAIDALRALPHPDQPRARIAAHPLQVFELPER
jgi:ubiquinone/menaquinone biosynthesis C-methylase UbiE